MAQEGTHTKSSKQEDDRYLHLVSLEKQGLIFNLVRQITLKPEINGIVVFEYTPDFLYKYKDREGNVIPVVEEFKGHEFQRHDFRLRMRICSAIYPEIEFKIVFPKRVGTVYKAGKVLTRGNKKASLPKGVNRKA